MPIHEIDVNHTPRAQGRPAAAEAGEADRRAGCSRASRHELRVGEDAPRPEGDDVARTQGRTVHPADRSPCGGRRVSRRQIAARRIDVEPLGLCRRGDAEQAEQRQDGDGATKLHEQSVTMLRNGPTLADRLTGRSADAHRTDSAFSRSAVDGDERHLNGGQLLDRIRAEPRREPQRRQLRRVLRA